MAATLIFDDQFFRASLTANNNAVLPGPGSTGNYTYYPDPTGSANVTTSGFGVGIGATGTPNHQYQCNWLTPTPAGVGKNGSWLLPPVQPGANQAIVLWCPTSPQMVNPNFGIILRATAGATPTAYICQFGFGYANNGNRLIQRLGFNGSDTYAGPSGGGANLGTVPLGNSSITNNWKSNAAVTTLTSSVAAGASTLPVAATTNFAVGTWVYIEDGTNGELCRIGSINAGVSLVIDRPGTGQTANAHASGLNVRSTFEAETIVIAMIVGNSMRLIIRSGLDPNGASGVYNASTNWNGLVYYDTGSGGVSDPNTSPLSTGSVGFWSGTSNSQYFNRIQVYNIGALTDVPTLTSSALIAPVVPTLAPTQVSFSGLTILKGAAWQTGGNYPQSSYTPVNTRSSQVAGGYGAFTNTGTAANPVDATVPAASQNYYKQTATDASQTAATVIMPARTPSSATVFPYAETGDSIVDNHPKTAVEPGGTSISTNPQYPHYEKFFLERTQDGRQCDVLAIGFSGSKCQDWVGANGTGTITAVGGGGTTGTVSPASVLSGAATGASGDYILIEDEIVQLSAANSGTGAATFAATARSHAANSKCAILKWGEQFPQDLIATGGSTRGQQFINLGVAKTFRTLAAFFSLYPAYAGPKYVGVCFGANEANYTWYTQANFSTALNAFCLVLGSLGYTPLLHYPTYMSPYGTVENPIPISTSEGSTGQGWNAAGSESRVAFLDLCRQTIDSVVGTTITTTQYGTITVLAGHKAGLKVFSAKKKALYEGLHPGWTGAVRLAAMKALPFYALNTPQAVVSLF